MKVSIIRLMVLALILSGCAGAPPDAPDQDPDGEGIGAETSPVSLSLDGCSISILDTNSLALWAEPVVPEGFHLRDDPDVTVLIELLACARVTTNLTVVQQVHLMMVSIVVDKEFEGGTSRFPRVVVMTLTDAPLLVKVLSALPTEVGLAEFRSEATADPSGGTAYDWTIRADDLSVAFRSTDFGANEGQQNNKHERWLPGPPHTLAEIDVTFEQSGARDKGGVLLQLSGSTNLNRLLGSSSSWPFLHQERWNAKVDFSLSGGYDP